MADEPTPIAQGRGPAGPPNPRATGPRTPETRLVRSRTRGPTGSCRLRWSRYGATGGVVDALRRRSARIPPLWAFVGLIGPRRRRRRSTLAARLFPTRDPESPDLTLWRIALPSIAE